MVRQSDQANSQEELNRDFMVWLALDLEVEPFTMVNNKALRYFFT